MATGRTGTNHIFACGDTLATALKQTQFNQTLLQ